MSAAEIQRERVEAYRQSAEEVLAALGMDGRRGLSETEARARLEHHGRNELTAEKPVPAWRKFLAQFRDALVILLLVATLISAGLWLFERESALPYEALAVFAVVLLNAVMGYVQESRAEAAVAALCQMSKGLVAPASSASSETAKARPCWHGLIWTRSPCGRTPVCPMLRHSPQLIWPGKRSASRTPAALMSM